MHEDGSIRFATRESVRGVISRLEAVAVRNGDKFRVTKSSGARVRIEGGEKGRLAVEVEIFSVLAEVLVVKVKMAGGDSLEYRRFCCEEIRPAMKDIIWASSDSNATVN